MFLLVLVLGFGGIAEAGFLRDKIKERFVEKQKEKPAPVVTGEVSSKIEKAGNYTFSFTFGGMERFYKVHVPASYKSSTPMPLLFVLHGGGGDMEIQATDKYYKQISKSESEGFIAVFPNGSSQFKSGKLATWNAGNCCGQGRDKNVDDVGFIREVFKKVSAQVNVDSQKVYAAGMSNGGMMSYRLACEASDIFKAIAAVAGTDNTEECNPKKPISVLHIHAKDDDHVQFNGGAGAEAFKDKSMVTEFVSVPKTVEKWVGLESCEAKSQRVLEKSGAYCERYKCKASSVQLCVTDTGKHSWPGGTKPRAIMMGSAPSDAISANDVMWDFFKSL